MFSSKKALLLSLALVSCFRISLCGSQEDFGEIIIETNDNLVKKLVCNKSLEHSDRIVDISFLEDGSLVTAAHNGDINFWSLEKENVFAAIASKSGISFIDVLNNKHMLIIKNYNDHARVHVCDFTKKDKKYYYDKTFDTNINGRISSAVHFSDKQAYIALYDSKNKTGLIEDVNGKCIFQKKKYRLNISKINEEKILITANNSTISSKASLTIFDVKNKKTISEESLNEKISDCKVLDSKTVWLCIGKKLVCWNFEEKAPRGTIDLPEEARIISVTSGFVAAACGTQVLVYNSGDLKQHCIFKLGEKKYNYISSMAFSPQGKLVIAASLVVNYRNTGYTNNDVFVAILPKKSINKEFTIN